MNFYEHIQQYPDLYPETKEYKDIRRPDIQAIIDRAKEKKVLDKRQAIV